MGQFNCALVLFFVIFSDAWSAHSSPEKDDAVCTKDHPLYPYIKLFNEIPEEWKSGNDLPERRTKIVCFTKKLTTEIDSSGSELKYSGYEITFGLPKKYLKNLPKQEHSIKGDQSIINYPEIEETNVRDDMTIKNKIHIRCMKKNEKITTTTEPPTTTNLDLDFLNDLDEICDEHLDIDILNSLPDEVTSKPEYTRKQGEDLIEFTTDIPASTEENQTESVVLLENIQSRMDIEGELIVELTTEITTLINQIIMETTTSADTTTEKETTIIETTTQLPVTEAMTEVSTNEETTTETVSTISTEPTMLNDRFIIQFKHYASTNSDTDCYHINKTIKYGKCLEPLIPIRIIAESYLPTDVNLQLIENLEANKEDDEIIVSGKSNCYLLKTIAYIECPTNVDNLTTAFEIDDLPDNPDDKPYFSIEFKGECTRVSKKVDVIECPAYQDTLPHLDVEHLPDHVRFKHTPGEINVDTDDIIIHSSSHCLLLKTMIDAKCKDKPDIVLKEMVTSRKTIDEEPSPTLRFADYSFERLAGIVPKSFADHEESDQFKVRLTTPCNSGEFADPISRTTRNLPDSTITTESPEADRRTTICEEDNINCLIEKIKLQAKELKSRRTIHPTISIEMTRSPSFFATIAPTKRTEITIPRSLSKLLHTIINESNDPSPRSSTLFKPDFIIRVACAEKISKTNCFKTSKYIMQPPSDDPNIYNNLIDKANFPVDIKLVPTSNLHIFEANETIYAKSGQERFVLIKKNEVDCPLHPKDSFYVLDTGFCGPQLRKYKHKPEREFGPEPKYEPEHEPEPEAEVEAEPKYEEPKYEEHKYEEPKYEEPKYEEPKYEEPKYEEPEYEEPKYEEPKYEEPEYEEPKNEEPKYEEPKYEEPKYVKPKYVKPKNEGSRNEEPKNEEPKNEEPKHEEPKHVEPEYVEPTIVKYPKGKKVYCFDFDQELKLHLVKCPVDLSAVPVLSRPEDLKTLCRSQLKNKGHTEQMKLLKRMNILV